MLDVIGDTLPLATGIALSPVPVIAMILLLLSPTGRASSVGYLIGWLFGIVVGVGVFTAASGLLPDPGGEQPWPVSGVVKIVLGTLLVVLSVRQWDSRPRDARTAGLPGWMTTIDRFGAVRAAGLGTALAVANPKNLLLAMSAGLLIGGAGLDTGSEAVVVAIFSALAGSSIIGPVVAYVVAAQRMAGVLAAVRRWLVQNNATIMAVLTLVIGVVMVGKGIASS